MGTLAWCDGRNSPVEGSFESSEPRVLAIQDSAGGARVWKEGQ